MVSEGMSFTEAYAGAPVCAPSRCTLITGRHSGHCSVRSNGPNLTPGTTDTGVADVLKKAGYHTRHIGKWGLGGFGTGASPLDKGFDYYYGQLSQGYCHNYYPDHMDHGVVLQNGTQQTSEIPIPANTNASEYNCGTDHLKCAWSGDLWTNDTLRFIGSAPATPWYLYLSYTAPHAGSIGSNGEGQPPVPRISSGPYESRAEELGKEIGYASAVTEIDRQLGLVFDALESSDLAGNTVVFFASDNGASNEGNHGYEFFSSSGPLNGFKRSLHEGGHRSPLIVRWPGQIAAGSNSKQQFAFYDFMATAIELAGGNPVADLPANQTDGDSLVPTLLGKPQAQKAFIYHEYCAPNEAHSGWGQALRVGNWSAVCVGPKPTNGWPVCNNDTIMIYDLSTDVGQKNNVAKSNPAIVASMFEQLKTVRVNGHYCGEPGSGPKPSPPSPPPGPPSPPSPPGPPIAPGSLNGTWYQGSHGNGGKGAMIAIEVVGPLGIRFTTESNCCMWTSGTGSVTADGQTMTVTATGPDGFTTSETGAVRRSGPGGGYVIDWAPSGGAHKHWADWSKSDEAAN